MIKEQITYNDFDKVDIRIGTVISAKKNHDCRLKPSKEAQKAPKTPPKRPRSPKSGPGEAQTPKSL